MSTNNDGKTTTWRIIDVALILIIGLLGTVWGLTWRGTDKKAVEAYQKAEKACDDIQFTREFTKEFIAAQKEVNKNTDEKLDAILREVRRIK